MKERGQLNHVFTIIATLLIAAVIIFVGAKLLGNVINTKCDSDFITFKDKIEISIKNDNNFGSVTEENFRVPCKYNLLCFVNTEQIGQDLSSGDFPEKLSSEAEFILHNSIKDNVQANIFLISSKGVIFPSTLLIAVIAMSFVFSVIFFFKSSISIFPSLSIPITFNMACFSLQSFCQGR